MSADGNKRFTIKVKTGNTTSVLEREEEFKQIHLYQNYPNPFNPSTEITYSIPNVTQVKLSIYTVLGEKVAELESGIKTAGSHKVSFDASHLSSGLYLYRLEAGNKIITKKMLLVK
jgi:hypothetical protein